MGFAVFFVFLIISALSTSRKYWFLETFEDNFENRWIRSKHYDGNAVWDEENKLLLFPKPKSRYGMVCPFEKPFSNEGLDLLIQFEVKFSKYVECGSVYLKLIYEDCFPNREYDSFSNKTTFAIMFGPDRCILSTKKRDGVKFVINFNNERCEKWEKKQYMRPPRIINDLKTHLYKLKIKSDNTFEYWIDREHIKAGSFFKDFEPPITPSRFFKVNDRRLTKPRNIKNKCFYEPEEPYKFKPIGAVALELYSGFSENISINNILISSNETFSDKFAEYTWFRTFQMENYERPFHYDEDFNIFFDGPEKLSFEKDFECDEL